jgi:hypothetical protein
MPCDGKGRLDNLLLEVITTGLTLLTAGKHNFSITISFDIGVEAPATVTISQNNHGRHLASSETSAQIS